MFSNGYSGIIIIWALSACIRGLLQATKPSDKYVIDLRDIEPTQMTEELFSTIGVSNQPYECMYKKKAKLQDFSEFELLQIWN